MPNLTITSLTGSVVPLVDFYSQTKPGAPLVAWRASSDLPRMLDLLKRWKDGEVSVAFEFLPEEIAALGKEPTMREMGDWVKDNIAANQVNAAIPVLGTTINERLMTTGGVVIGIKSQLSETPGGSALGLVISQNGAPSAAVASIAIGGPVDNIAMLATPLEYAALDKLGIMVNTGAGWTTVNLDALVSLLVIDNAPI